jgi:hypothetical protein
MSVQSAQAARACGPWFPMPFGFPHDAFEYIPRALQLSHASYGIPLLTGICGLSCAYHMCPNTNALTLQVDRDLHHNATISSAKHVCESSNVPGSHKLACPQTTVHMLHLYAACHCAARHPAVHSTRNGCEHRLQSWPCMATGEHRSPPAPLLVQLQRRPQRDHPWSQC